MENTPIDKEWEYWDKEISGEDLEKLAEQGQQLLDWPKVMQYRVKRFTWNYRIKKRYRPEID